MTKEKIVSLTKYQVQLKEKLSATTFPAKHKSRPLQYTQYLANELATVTRQLDDAKLEGVK